MAGEIGVIGLLMFMWLLVMLFRQCFRGYKAMGDPFMKTVLLSVTLSLFAFLVNGLTETSLYYARVAVLFWCMTGFALALSSPRQSLNDYPGGSPNKKTQ